MLNIFFLSTIGDSELKVGIRTMVHPQWVPFIADYKFVMTGTAQYVILNLWHIFVAFLNVYALNSVFERTQFWNTLVDSLPQANTRRIAGDFNMVESSVDRTLSDGVVLSGIELHACEALQFHFGVTNAWSYTHMYGSLLFSRSDRRFGSRGISRIDRIYVDALFAKNSGEIGILPTATFSEHAQVVLNLEDDSVRSMSHIRIPNVLFQKQEMRNSFAKIWRDARLTIYHF